ncbi:trypsin-like [Folsomia candida]|uniref:Kallikrein-13 n=1 Tax=Folsomia candida TaxID=158441 RepID=A0A226DP12_FOLCA|nr:trypsin-like [Folsomia candida]OXA47272.1 Kallikrein-13 [Folsomia candida]
MSPIRNLFLYSLILVIKSFQQANATVGPGVYVAPGHLPYQVSISTAGLLCGGVLYSEIVVITAAHCIYDGTGKLRSASDLLIYAGSVEQFKGEMRTASSYVIAPNFVNRGGLHDIALIKLTQPFQLGTKIQPVRIAENGVYFQPGTKCILAGFGQKDSSTSLKEVTVRIRSGTVCRAINARTWDANTMVCAGGLLGEGNSCGGDSGGPLICNGVLYGIVVMGEDVCSGTMATTYTNIAKYHDWIIQTANSFGSRINSNNEIGHDFKGYQFKPMPSLNNMNGMKFNWKSFQYQSSNSQSQWQSQSSS